MTLEIPKDKNILKDVIGFDPTKALTKDIELDVELEEIKENGENLEPEVVANQITTHLVLNRHIITKDEIIEQLDSWQKFRRYNLDKKKLMEIVNGIWNNKRTFQKIKSIAFDLGRQKIDVLFTKGQTIEIAEYLKGRYHVKRIDVDGKLLFFNDMFYEEKAVDLIKRKSREFLSDTSKNEIKEIIAYIEDTCDLIVLSDIEKHVHLKCLLNGIYDIKTGKFSMGFTPEYIILNQIPHLYDENKKFDAINKVVSDIIENKKDRQSFYDFIGTCLYPYSGIDIQFGGIGQPGTGKSQLCDLVALTLGEDNVNEASIHSLSKDKTTQVDAVYKMCNIDRDMSEDDIAQTSLLKKWISQDRMNARAIYERSGNFRPTARLMFMTNDLYEISNHDDAEAIYDRTHLIKIDKRMRGNEGEVKKIINKIATPDELDGFITYLLKNAHELHKIENIHHPMKNNEVEQLWNQHGNRIREFIAKWFVKDPEYKTERQEVYNKWLNHALEKKFPAKGRDTFYDQFEEIIGMSVVGTRVEGISGRYYVGLRLLKESEIGLQESMKDD